MARAETAQLNIRSRFARERVAALARTTGMTATQVVEEALRAYAPPPDGPAPPGLIRKGPLLVRPAGGRRVSFAQAEAALDEVRSGRG